MKSADHICKEDELEGVEEHLMAVVEPDPSGERFTGPVQLAQKVLILRPEDSEFVARLLRNPPEPKERLCDAARHYRASIVI